VGVWREKLFVGEYTLYRQRGKQKNYYKSWQKMQQGSQQEGTVMVGGDWNCKIGEIQSEAGDRTYERQSVSKKVDTRGKKMMEIMNVLGAKELNIHISIEKETHTSIVMV
jgi:hypothetical protein